MSGMQFTWVGEKDRPLGVRRPCDCGTCRSSQPPGAVGLLTGSDSEGKGFTVWITDEAVYRSLALLHGGAGLPSASEEEQ
jgi:hypothetical protein